MGLTALEQALLYVAPQPKMLWNTLPFVFSLKELFPYLRYSVLNPLNMIAVKM